MEEIFQELVISVGISVAVCCMIMKLKPYGDEEGGEALKRSYGGFEKAGFSGQESEEHQLKNRGVWPFPEFFEQLSVDRLYETDVIDHGEIDSDVVEDEEMVLQDLSSVKEDEGDHSNVIDDRKIVSEIVEDFEVFETMIRKEEDADGCTERLSVHKTVENSHNSLEENTLRLNEIEIEHEVRRVGDEGIERENLDEVVKGMYKDEGVIEHRSEEVSRISSVDEEQCEDRGDKEEEGVFDDWEGVERTELEKLFGAAVVFVSSKSNAGLIDKDKKIELYGLHKVAIEGPCRGAQPMAFNVSARAKWFSWKRLGNMSRELAMEQYLRTLSERVPGWMSSNLQVKPSQ